MKGPDHAVNETVDYKAADIQKLIKEISNSSEKDQINQHFDMNSVPKIYKINSAQRKSMRNSEKSNFLKVFQNSGS